TRHFHACPSNPEHTVVTFFGELLLLHLGWRSHPQACGQVVLAFEETRSCREVTNVGHAATNEYLVDGRACDIRQTLDVIRGVGASAAGRLDVVATSREGAGN